MEENKIINFLCHPYPDTIIVLWYGCSGNTPPSFLFCSPRDSLSYFPLLFIVYISPLIHHFLDRGKRAGNWVYGLQGTERVL